MNFAPPKLIVGAVSFERIELRDFFGPLQMFGLNKNKLEVVTLGLRASEVASNRGPASSRGVVDKTFAESPPIDLLLIPGRFGTRKEVETQDPIEYLREKAERAAYAAIVCIGTNLFGRERAPTNARGCKYEWHEDSTQDPFAKLAGLVP